MRKLSILMLFIAFPFLMGSCQAKYPNLSNGLYAEFTTNKGIFIAKLYDEATPLTVANFVSLAEGKNELADKEYQGKNYYDGLIFHRVIKDFMIQGGDPTGTGSGSPGYRFPDEIVDSLQFTGKGILAMANSGPETNGSQFFITLKETPWLNGNHTIFGEIVEGQDVVDAIGVVETKNDRPVKDVVMEKVTIIRKGKTNLPSFSEKMAQIEKEREEKEARRKQVAAEKAKELDNLKAQANAYDSGIAIYVNEEGDGPKPEIGQRAHLNYAGYLPDGSLFDSNILEIAEKYDLVNEKRKEANLYIPLTTVYSMEAQMIPGFKEAMLTMKIGDKITVFIPSHLAYGDRGVPGVIPPGSELIFEMTLVDVD